MSKLPRADNPKEMKYWTIRQLRRLYKAEESDDDMAWTERKPSRRDVSFLLSEFRRLRDNVRSLALLAQEGLLDRNRPLPWLKPPKRKRADPLDRAADYAAGDAQRIKVLWKENGLKPPGNINDRAAEIAIEWHLLILRTSRRREAQLMAATLSEEDNRFRLLEKVCRRVEKPSGSSRRERRMAKEKFRAN